MFIVVRVILFKKHRLSRNKGRPVSGSTVQLVLTFPVMSANNYNTSLRHSSVHPARTDSRDQPPSAAAEGGCSPAAKTINNSHQRANNVGSGCLFPCLTRLQQGKNTNPMQEKTKIKTAICSQDATNVWIHSCPWKVGHEMPSLCDEMGRNVAKYLPDSL